MKRKIFALVLCIAVLAACVLGLAACSSEAITPTTFEMPQGSRPNYTSLFSAEDKALIDGVAFGSITDETEIKKAVLALYNTANASRINTKLSLVVQESDAGISMGQVIMHAYNLRNGDKWYYQLATSATANEGLSAWIGSLMGPVLAATAGYTKVAYTTGDGSYWFFAGKGESYNCDCTIPTFPYAEVAIQESDNAFSEPYTLEQFNDKLHVLSDSIHEISNIDFNAAVLKDGATITCENGVYTVTFSVDCKKSGDEWYRKAQEDMREGDNEIKSYEYYDATLEVWDNGYAKAYQCSSKRDAGMASGAPKDNFSYIWNEDEILALLQQDASLGAEDEVELVDDYLNFAMTHEFVNTSKLNIFEIIGIVAGCIAGVVIIIVVTIEVLVKQGALPKLAQRRADKKARRASKKAQRANAQINEGDGIATATSEPIDEAFAVAADDDAQGSDNEQ